MLMRIARHTQGFTVIELLIGMVITSIVLAAIATLAFAMSVASTASDDIAVTQAQLRQATLRLRELIGTCQLVCAAPGNDLVLWRADDNADHRINVNELVYVERGDTGTLLQLCQFSVAGNPSVALSDLALASTKSQLLSAGSVTRTPLIPQCKNVTFAFYPVPPPLTRVQCLMTSFTVTESGCDHRYEIIASLRSRAGHLLNQAGDALVTSDDD
jgi:prepilin-type N-terminal cleavage/methylation domain-containing protein